MTRRRQELPGSDEPGSYRWADHIARTQVCAECGAGLAVRHRDVWVALCYADETHQGTKPAPTTKEMIADKLAAVERGNAAAKGRSPEERAEIRRGMWEGE